MIQLMLAIWFLVPLPFVKAAWTSGSSQFTYCWSLSWRISSITLLACEMRLIAQSFEHSLALPPFGSGVKTDLFQSCGPCWVSKFTAILSAALSQHHLWGFEITQLEFHHLHLLCSKWCSLRPTWLHIPGCLALGDWSHHRDHLGHEDLFVQFFCVFLPLLNIIFFCYVHTISVLYWAHLCMKYSLGMSYILEEISSLSHCIVFLYFFALITEEGFISPCYSLELYFQMGMFFLFSLAVCFSSFHSGL